jgi:hypothetical protein
MVILWSTGLLTTIVVSWLVGLFLLLPLEALEHRASVKCFVSLQFLDLRQSVGLLGRGISWTHGATYTEHKHRINADRHPCLEWDSNLRSPCSSGRRHFMSYRADTVIGARAVTYSYIWLCHTETGRPNWCSGSTIFCGHQIQISAPLTWFIVSCFFLVSPYGLPVITVKQAISVAWKSFLGRPHDYSTFST